MSRARVLGSIACIGFVAACSKLIEATGAAPNRDAVTIVLQNVPDTLFIGDSAGVYVQINDKDGRPAWNDTVAVWQSSDVSIASLDPSHPPTPTPHGFTWVYGKRSGQATISAQTKNLSASKVVTIVGPADIGAGDSRFGYALADQPALPGPYKPDAGYRFNSSSGDVTITRDSVGWYNVRFAGLARKPNQRDNAQATAFGSPPGVHCKLLRSVIDGADMIVPVHCHQGNAAIDSRFTVLFSGARAFDLTTPFAFALRLPTAQFLSLDTSATAFNSVSGHIGFARTGVGNYNFGFPGFETFTGPAAFLATAVNTTADHCRVENYTLGGGFVASCFAPDGTPSDGGVNIMQFTRGRVGHRYAYASTQNVTAVTPPVDPTLTRNSSGGSATSRRLGVGQWTVTFAGLGRPAGGTEIVIVSALKETDHSCSLVTWGNTGTADLTVTLQCVNPSGALVDARFSVLVVE